MAAVDLSIGPPGAPEVSADAHDGTRTRTEGPFVDDALLEVEEAPPVDELVVRTLLSSMGGMANVAFGDEDVVDHWEFTDRELDQLTPPLTRWINRQPRLRRAVAHGDELAVGLALAGYAGRNIAAGQQARAAREDQEGAHAHVDRQAPPSPGPAGAPAGGADGRRWGSAHGREDGSGVRPPAGGGLG